MTNWSSENCKLNQTNYNHQKIYFYLFITSNKNKILNFNSLLNAEN